MFTIAVNGTYPRLPDPPRPALLQRAIDDFAAGKIEEKDLRRAEDRASIETVAEMVAAGVEVASGGQIHWGNPEEFISRKLSGFRLDQDKNAPGQINRPAPRAVERIKWVRPLVLDEYKFLSERSPVDIRPVLTGPFSLALMYDTSEYPSGYTDFQDDLAAALNRELIGLVSAGARFILIEEPLLTNRKLFIDDFIRISKILLEGVECSIMLGTSRGDLRGLERITDECSFSGYALDMIEGVGNHDLLENKVFPDDCIIQLGVVHSRHPRLEEAEEITERLLKCAKFHDPGLTWAAPTGGLGILPRDLAFEKLSALYRGVLKARKQLAGEEEPGGKVPEDNSDHDLS